MAEVSESRLRLRGRFFDLFALCGLALAQPTLDILGKSSGLFLTYNTTLAQVLALVALILLVPPAVLLGVECLLWTVVPFRRRALLHGLVCGVAVGVMAWEVLRHGIGTGPVLAILGGVLAMIATAVLLARLAPARTFVRVLAIAPIIFAVSFFGFSPASGVVLDTGHRGTSSAVTSPHRVVLVILDEFPLTSLLDGQGAIDRELYPNFAALAQGSTWYRNSRTVAAFTQWAVPAILTGRYPTTEAAAPTVASYPDSLFTMLAGTYDINAHEAVTRLCPSDICNRPSSIGVGDLARKTADLWWTFASKPPHTVKFDDAGAPKYAESSVGQFMTSLRPAAPSARPKLDFLHVELPHYPWRFLPALQRFPYSIGDPPGESYLGLWPSRPALEAAHERHLLQVGAVDTLLGRIVARLKAIGAYDDSLVMVTADHGSSFQLGEPARNPSANNLSDIAWTPLFVKYPHQAHGVVDDHRAESIDVVPTIAKVVGARRAPRFDGVSLRGATRPDGIGRMYPWLFRPTTKDLAPPPGRAYLDVDGPAGFARVLRARAAPPGAVPRLRIYQRGEFGPMVGRAVPDYHRAAPGPAAAKIQHLEWFARIDPNAFDAPWIWNTGNVSGVAIETPLAIASHGRIIAVTAAQLPTNGVAPFTFLVPPTLLAHGRNDLSVYVIRGTAASPDLEPVALTAG